MKNITSLFIKTVAMRALLLFTLFSVSAFAQSLPTFTLSVTPTEETCAGNGSLAISTSGTDLNATVTNYVYRAPNYSTPVYIFVGTSGTPSGLTNGSYRVVSVQSRTGYVSNQQVWNGTIANSLPPALTYTTTNQGEICGNDGSITVTKTGSGILNATNPYELWNAAGTVNIRPAQSSNQFLGLPAGTYLVKVMDSCGQYVTQSVTIIKLTPNVNFAATGSIGESSVQCKERILFEINSGSTTSVVNYPINIKIYIYNPSNVLVDTISDTQTNDYVDFISTTSSIRYFYDIPYFGTADYHYTIEITDDCNKVYTKDVAVIANPYLTTRTQITCAGNYFTVASNHLSFPLTYTVTGSGSASSYGTQTFTNVTNEINGDDISVGSATSLPPNGTYTITATDPCGNSATATYSLNNLVGTPSTYSGPGCGEGNINIGSYAPAGVAFASAVIISAPAAYTGPTTATVDSTNEQETFNVITWNTKSGKSWAELNGVPAGTYTIRITDSCGRTYDVTRNETGTTNGTVVIDQVLACGSFNLNLSINGSNTFNDQYVLEWLNAATGNWEQEGGNLVNNSANGSFAKEGQYRVIKKYQVKGASYFSGNFWYNGYDCSAVLKTFTYKANMLQIDVVNAFACPDGIHYDLFASASKGVAPYTFQIVAKQGDASFVATNPTNSIAATAFWTGLTAGIYKIRVTDSCLNTKEIWVDVTALPAPKITATNLCEGQNGTLSVQNIPYLNFSWTKDSNPTVLSTTSTLNFTPFSVATHAGTYYLHITSSVAGSCVNQTLSFIVGTNFNPNAGPDVTVPTICNTIVNINLDTLLDSTADKNGSWTEITSPASGYLFNGVWSPSQAGAGTYYFQYTVTGLCSGQDTAIYTVTVNECGACYIDPVRTGAGVDSNHGITLLKRAGENNGNWPMIRKSAHTVLESNTKGFVITRMTSDPNAATATNHISKISNPVEGMMVYDEYSKCLKIYDGASWSCFTVATCP